MTTSDKLREIAKLELDKRIVGILMAHGSNAINATNSLPDLTALISENYYPKEFVEWMIAKAPHDTVYKTFGHVTANMEWITFNSLDELFNYWKENEQ